MSRGWDINFYFEDIYDNTLVQKAFVLASWSSTRLHTCMSTQLKGTTLNKKLTKKTSNMGSRPRITSDLHKRRTEVARLFDNVISDNKESREDTRTRVSGASSARVSRENNSTRCPECHKNLSSRGNLNRHMKMVHLGHRVYCTVAGCGMSFGQSHDLRRHVRRKHGGN